MRPWDAIVTQDVIIDSEIQPSKKLIQGRNPSQGGGAIHLNYTQVHTAGFVDHRQHFQLPMKTISNMI